MSNFSVIDEQLKKIAEESWKHYDDFKDKTFTNKNGETKKFVVENSMPILYFGDLDAYQKSPIKIVTVALNPSDKEFPDYNRTYRFPLMESVDINNRDQQFYGHYFKSLNQYFSTKKHYDPWFGTKLGNIGFEPILNGVKSSFWEIGGSFSTAVHTDLFTPLATSPTWDKLIKDDREPRGNKATDEIKPFGVAIWWDLINYLRPDIIILSLGEVHFSHMKIPKFGSLEWGNPIYTVTDKKDGTPRKTPYEIKILKKRLFADKDTLFISGNSSIHPPFAHIKTEDKKEIGKKIREHYRSHFNQ